MDRIKEIEKYKTLLDDGVINEDEFRKLKQKLLGLKTDEEKAQEKLQEREEALAEIEKLRVEKRGKEDDDEIFGGQYHTEKNNVLSGEQDELEDEWQKNYDQLFMKEMAKEKARLRALEEEKEEQREMFVKSTKAATSMAINVIITIILWIATVFCLLLTIAGFGGAFEGTLGIMSGVIMLLLTIMACPLITMKTKDISQLAVYYKYKKFIAIALVIIYFVIVAMMP